MSRFYYIYKVEQDGEACSPDCEYAIPFDDIESREQAEELLSEGRIDRGYLSYEEIRVDNDHHFIGYFFDGDSGEPPEECSWKEVFNSVEHLKIYWHSNGICVGDGHFEYQRIEEVVNGEVSVVEVRWDAKSGEFLG